MKRHFFSALILLFAVLLYALGFTGRGAALVVLGAGFELWFWARALRLKLPTSGHSVQV